MRLSKKGEQKQENKQVNLSEAQKALYKPVWSQEIPVGKYIGRTLKWVKDNDPKYHQWMIESEAAYSWGCYQIDGETMVKKKRYDKYYRDNGDVWLTIEMVNEPSIPWEDIENQ